MKNKSSKAVDGTGSIDSDSNELHVPHLEIYIASLYLIVEQDQDIPPKDPDIIQDRELDIRFHDKTRYDKKNIRVDNRLFDIAWTNEEFGFEVYWHI